MSNSAWTLFILNSPYDKFLMSGESTDSLYRNVMADIIFILGESRATYQDSAKGGAQFIIIEFAKEYGITISQCYEMFFNHSRYGMDLARKRLKILEERGYLLKGKPWDTNKTVYYIGRIPSTHRILLADFYSELIYEGAVIMEFIPEYKTSELRADALIRYIYKGYEVIQFIEVILTHKLNIEKYERLKDTGEVQNKYDIFPSLIILDHNPIAYKSNNIKVAYVNHNLDNFKNVVLP
ncbi:hypothetical protein [Clostridium cylindrosporum]|uniref:Uncharacterized protein n=1 Tax=Clostridium cylindrosporum DSM 605 TaxID=1121307 RepID=A0A0J8G5P6_CLOCY|nr:hypothetical protein [Clostridium cylindrosporum]KMT22966.1 hypothetical protein CLCY_7c00130 [Clostridium cylindrosporum DSM 605]